MILFCEIIFGSVMIRFILLIFVIFSLIISSAYSQYGRGNQLQGVPQKTRIIGEFLHETFEVLPGDQFYRAEDLWKSLGSQKMKVSDPRGGKDLVKTLTIDDADIIEGFIKFVYNSRNETINSMTVSTELDKGDTFLDKFIELEGQYEPSSKTAKNVEFSGTYTFDDYIIRVSESSKEEKFDFIITKRANVIRPGTTNRFR
jgi:hypothetical protein